MRIVLDSNFIIEKLDANGSRIFGLGIDDSSVISLSRESECLVRNYKGFVRESNVSERERER